MRKLLVIAVSTVMVVPSLAVMLEEVGEHQLAQTETDAEFVTKNGTSDVTEAMRAKKIAREAREAANPLNKVMKPITNDGSSGF